MISVLGLCLASATASADPNPPPTPPDNLLSCVNRGFGLQKCVLDNTTVLGKAIVEDDQAYQTTMTVRYDFPCTGHPVQLGTTYGTTFFSMHAIGAVIVVDGLGDLKGFDPSPDVTRSLTFNTACKLHLTKVTRLPSTNTIQIWTLQAQAQQRIVELANDRFQIGRDFTILSQYNVENLQDLADRLQELLDGIDPVENPDLHDSVEVCLNATLAAINGQPPSDTLERIRQAGGDVVVILQAELNEELDKANHLTERFTRWELEIPPGLAGSIAVATFVLEGAN